MSQDPIAVRIQRMVCETLRISPDRYSEDLEAGSIPEWDSLGQVSLLQAAEAEFSIALDVQDALNIQSVAELMDTIRKYTE
jgi:acyl carrier protein